jgi:hypothetical protein
MRRRISLYFWKSLGHPALAALAAAAAVGIPAKWITLTHPLISNRASAALFVGATALFSTLAYAVSLRIIGVLDHQDMELIKSIFRKGSPPAPTIPDPSSETAT